MRRWLHSPFHSPETRRPALYASAWADSKPRAHAMRIPYAKQANKPILNTGAHEAGCSREAVLTAKEKSIVFSVSETCS